jgi:hypothetical protein
MSIAQPETEIETTTHFEQMVKDLMPEEEPGDGQNARAHIVTPDMNTHIWEVGMTSADMVVVARTTGQELVALCGYRWVPKLKTENLDVCDTCLAIAGERMRRAGE